MMFNRVCASVHKIDHKTLINTFKDNVAKYLYNKFNEKTVIRMAALFLTVITVYISHYCVTAGFSNLPTETDLSWLKASNALIGATPSEGFPFMGLFVYAVTFMRGIIGRTFFGLEVVLFLFHSVLTYVTFLAVTNLFGNWRAGIVACLLSGFHPFMLAALEMSAYSMVTSLSWMSLALYISSSASLKRKFAVPALVVISALVGVSDPRLGLIWILTFILREIFPVKKGFLRRIFIAFLASLPCGMISLFLIPYFKQAISPLSFLIEPVPTFIMLLSAILGGYLLLRKGNAESLGWAFSWLISSALILIVLDGSLTTVFGIINLPSFLILTSALILHVDKDIICIIDNKTSNIHELSKKNEVGRLVEVDMRKLVSFFLLIGVLLLSVNTSFNVYVYASATYRSIRGQYGDKELWEALTWIESKTSKEAVIATHNTLGDYIEAITGRTSLSDTPLIPNIESERSNAADLLLHSNVEIRNEFLRIRDETPHRTDHTPLFAIYKGERFKNIFYIVDAYNQVSFESGGENCIEAPYNWTEFSMAWVEQTKARRTIIMRFRTFHNLTFEKVLSLDEGSGEAVLSYTVKPDPNNLVRFNSMNISIWIPTGSKASWGNVNIIEQVESRILEVNYRNEGNESVRISSNPYPELMELGLDPDGGQQRLLTTFIPINNTLQVSLKFLFLSAVESTWNKGTEGLISDEVIQRYNVTHIAVARSFEGLYGLSHDSRFREIYSSNPRIVIFEVKIDDGH